MTITKSKKHNYHSTFYEKFLQLKQLKNKINCYTLWNKGGIKYIKLFTVQWVNNTNIYLNFKMQILYEGTVKQIRVKN